MKQFITYFVACFTTAALAQFANAGAGHDHGDAAPAATGPALPRFSAQSDLFEAVGVLGKDELVLFIDRSATNEPVLNATVELESGGIKTIGTFEATLGEYHFDSKPFQQSAVYPIALTIKAGNDADLLSAELDVHGAEAGAAQGGAHSHSWREYALWIGAALASVALAAAVLIVVRRKKTRLEVRDRSAA
jgi:hypothetical protein